MSLRCVQCKTKLLQVLKTALFLCSSIIEVGCQSMRSGGVIHVNKCRSQKWITPKTAKVYTMVPYETTDSV